MHGINTHTSNDIHKPFPSTTPLGEGTRLPIPSPPAPQLVPSISQMTQADQLGCTSRVMLLKCNTLINCTAVGLCL